MKFAKKIIDLLLYSNCYIAFCAIALTWQTQLLHFQHFSINPLTGFVFTSTLLVYALHRLIGLKKAEKFVREGRYKVIYAYQRHIWIYAIFAFLLSFYFFFFLKKEVKILLFFPVLLSLGYVLPLIGGKRRLRLRDLDGVKIFLVAFVWAFVTVLLPIAATRPLEPLDIAYFLERAVFIFAITLPFDVRDLALDQANAVQTIPSLWGTQVTQNLMLILMIFFVALAAVNYLYLLDNQGLSVFFALSISAFSTLWIAFLAMKKRHDYYFTGALDGTMWLQFALVWYFS